MMGPDWQDSYWFACSAALLVAAPASALIVADFGDSRTVQPSNSISVSANATVDLGLESEVTADGVGRPDTWLMTNGREPVVRLEETHDFFKVGLRPDRDSSQPGKQPRSRPRRSRRSGPPFRGERSERRRSPRTRLVSRPVMPDATIEWDRALPRESSRWH
jgi:hypothetical protein